jgi:hypothetical protein
MRMVAAVRQEASEVRWGSVLLLGMGVSLIWSVGLVSTYLRPSLHGLPLSLSAVVAALWVFLVFYKDSSDIRTAFTSAFFTLYLAFVAFSLHDGFASAFEDQNSFARSVWQNITTIMIAIIGFYFGGKALENVAQKKAARDSPAIMGDEAKH